MNSNNRLLGLDDKLFSKCNRIIEKALSGSNHLTRDELMAILNKAKISTESYRSIHIMVHAELDGIACNGKRRGKNSTYALLSERVPKKKIIAKEEALAKLAERYFSSHGPATINDFRWWSGLPAKDARNALEMVKANFVSEKIGEETYCFSNSFSMPKKEKSFVYLLPAFDEFLISYKDGSASFPLGNHKRAFTSNGIFRPVIVIDGHVRGVWKRTIKKEMVIIEIDSFQKQTKSNKDLIEIEAKSFGNFIGKEAEVKYSS